MSARFIRTHFDPMICRMWDVGTVFFKRGAGMVSVMLRL